MFYKIHYGLVATPVPLDIKLHPVSTRVENSLAYHIQPSSCDYHLYSFFPRTVRDWNILPEVVVKASSPEGYDLRITQFVFWYCTANHVSADITISGKLFHTTTMGLGIYYVGPVGTVGAVSR